MRRPYHGQRIVLRANRREGFPRERATYEAPSGNGCHIVWIHDTRDTFDDGMREITLDQIEVKDGRWATWTPKLTINTQAG